MDKISYQPIGIIHSPFTRPGDMPIQPAAAGGVEGWIEVFPGFVEGLQDLDGFSHIILLYHFHRAGPASLSVVPFLDTAPRGVFATRAPVRPNPIGLSVVELTAVEGDRLFIRRVDVLDETPLLDIKPYIPDFDPVEGVQTGWFALGSSDLGERRSDDRFAAGSEEDPR